MYFGGRTISRLLRSSSVLDRDSRVVCPFGAA